MDQFVYYAPVLGCLAMAAVMLLMMRGHGGGQHTAQPSATDAEIAQLRAEIAALKTEQAIQAQQAAQPTDAPAAAPKQR